MIGIDLFRRLRRRHMPGTVPDAVAAPPGDAGATTRLAREIATTGRYTMLATLAPPDRAAVALHLAAWLEDPSPLFTMLWRHATDSPHNVLTLAACLRAGARGSVLWPVRVVTALAEGGSGPAESDGVLQALLDCLPSLDGALDDLVRCGKAPRRLLGRLFDALPTELALPRLGRLAFDEATPAILAWDAADRLATLNAGIAVDLPATAGAAARWVYVDALHGAPGLRSLLETDALTCLRFFSTSTAGVRRCERAARALVTNAACGPALRLDALGILAQLDADASWNAIAAACLDEVSSLRRGAVALLTASAARDAIAALVRLALRRDAPADVRLESVLRLSVETTWDVAPVLQCCAGDGTLPLGARLRAAAALGRRASDYPRLLALLRDPQIHPEVRAAAARVVTVPAAIPDLVRLLLDTTTPAPVVTAACEALTAPACRPYAAVARRAMVRLLAVTRADVELTLAVIVALGRIGGEEAIGALGPLAGDGAAARLRGIVPAGMLTQPASACLAKDVMPAPLAMRLARALAMAPTSAEQPTTLEQFLTMEIDQIRCAAAAALASCGGAPATAAIEAAIRAGAGAGVAAALVVALDTSANDDTLLRLFLDSGLDAAIRWQVLERLLARRNGPALVRSALAQPGLDAYAQELAIEALGRCNDVVCAPLLIRLADDPASAPVLRERALAALGRLATPAAEITLARVAASTDRAPEERGLAAASLPAAISEATRSLLRDLVRDERPPAPLIAGALRALGRARDVAARPLMLRFSADERPEVAQAAIEALASCGDVSISPALVRAALNPYADATLKLVAIEALLQIGDADAVRLLRPYLGHGSLLLRMRAASLLAEHGHLGMVAEQLARDRLCPLPLRLYALMHLAGQPQATPVCVALLGDAAEDPQLRAAAVAGLNPGSALLEVMAIARDPLAPVTLRAACIAHPGRQGGVDAWLELSALAEDETDPWVRALAMHELHALLQPAMRQGDNDASDDHGS